MKNVIITIDTEGHRGVDPVSRLIWGKTESGAFGIDRIMDICDAYGAKGLFFVDIAEAFDYGKDKIAEVIMHILNRHHDVGVHIHPDHMADPQRLFLWEYSREEQFAIIKKCTDLYREITGEHPTAFRAGKYGANRDTLDIVNELGYEYDFSQFYGQKWCGINPALAHVLPQKYKDIILFPVTVFKSVQVPGYTRFDKIDATMDESEYRHVMDRIANFSDNSIVISLFYHSFSMLDWRSNPDNPRFNPKKESRFIRALEYVKQSDQFRFVPLLQLGNVRGVIKHGNPDSEKDIVCTKGLINQVWFAIKRLYGISRFNSKARVLLYALSLCCILLIVAFVYALGLVNQ